MVYFNAEVLAMQKRFPELLEIIRDRWGQMLDMGATTTWETFRGFTEDQMYGMWTRSWCHAWSASPAYFLSSHILGIHPGKPGFKHALIEPQLCDLTWVEGKMPTPHGNIEMRCEHQDGKITLQVILPASVSASIRLPAGPEAKISFDRASVSYSHERQVVVVELVAGARITIWIS